MSTSTNTRDNVPTSASTQTPLARPGRKADPAAYESGALPPDIDSLFKECMDLLGKIDASLSGAPLYSPGERSRATKLVAGGEKVVPVIAALVNEHGIRAPGKSVTPMLASLDRLQELAPMQRRLLRTLRRVEDLVIDAKATCWQDGSTYYGLLKELARRNPVIARDLEPVTEHFAVTRNENKVVERKKRLGTLQKQVEADEAAATRAKRSAAPESSITA